MTGSAGPNLFAMGEAALTYARLGYRVYPIYEAVAPGVCACGCAEPGCWRRAKHARILGRATAATTDEAPIRQWWARWPEANIGVAAAQSGLVVIDLDVAPARRDPLEAMRLRFGEAIVDTVMSETGGGGWHLYFRAPPEFVARSRKEFLGPGIDIRVYATMPPSNHISGRHFAWCQGKSPLEREPAAVPEALLTALRRRPGMGYYLRLAPFWLADRLHLSYTNRARVRKVERATRRLRERVQRK